MLLHGAVAPFVDAEIDLDNRIPAGHAAFFNSSSYTRSGYSSATSRRAKKEGLAETICTALENHAQLEGNLLSAMHSADREMIDKSIPEHDEMRRLIAAVRSTRPDGIDYDDTLMELMRLVIHHVADEETQLLPEAERVLHGRLAELGGEMTRRRMQLVRPRAGAIAINVARSYPAAAISIAALGVLGALAIALGAGGNGRRNGWIRGQRALFRW
jgi:hypothetical protein